MDLNIRTMKRHQCRHLALAQKGQPEEPVVSKINVEHLTTIRRQEGFYGVDFIPVGLLRDSSDLDIPYSACPAEGRAVDKTDWLERILSGVLSFKC